MGVEYEQFIQFMWKQNTLIITVTLVQTRRTVRNKKIKKRNFREVGEYSGNILCSQERSLGNFPSGTSLGPTIGEQKNIINIKKCFGG